MKSRMLFSIPVLFFSFCLFLGCNGPVNGPHNDNPIRGSGNVITIEESFSGFDKICLSHAFVADIQHSETYKTQIRIDDNLNGYLVSEQESTTLHIGLNPSYDYSHTNCAINICTPAVKELELSGTSTVTITGFNSDNNFFACLTGTSILSADLFADTITLILTGVGNVSMSGKADKLNVNADGVHTLHGKELLCNHADMQLTGVSKATITATSLLDVLLSGVSGLNYYGSPRLNSVSITGVSTLNKMN